MEDSLQKGIQNYECKIRYNREYLNKKKAKTNNWSFGDLGPFFSEIRNASIEMLPEYSPSLHGTFYSSQQLLAYTGPMHVRGPEAASFTAFASREALTPLLPGSLLNFSKLFQKCQNLRPKEDGPFTYRTKKEVEMRAVWKKLRFSSVLPCLKDGPHQTQVWIQPLFLSSCVILNMFLDPSKSQFPHL